MEQYPIFYICCCFFPPLCGALYFVFNDGLYYYFVWKFHNINLCLKQKNITKKKLNFTCTWKNIRNDSKPRLFTYTISRYVLNFLFLFLHIIIFLYQSGELVYIFFILRAAAFLYFHWKAKKHQKKPEHKRFSPHSLLRIIILHPTIFSICAKVTMIEKLRRRRRKKEEKNWERGKQSWELFLVLLFLLPSDQTSTLKIFASLLQYYFVHRLLRSLLLVRFLVILYIWNVMDAKRNA